MNLSRRMARNKKKQFSKQLKKSMKDLEKMVRCVVCDRVPNVISGEKVDNWQMKKTGDSIKLTCPLCMEGENADE